LDARVVAIVQARMGSSRLAGKVLMDLSGVPLAIRTLQRARMAKLVDDIWLATSDLAADDPLAEAAQRYGFKVFRGSESDVLARYAQTAVLAGADVVVRLTGDCPMLAPEVVDDVVACYFASGCDYCVGSTRSGYPRGFDTEVFSRAALEMANRDSVDPVEREHVTTFIDRRGGLFKRVITEAPDRFRRPWRLCVDEAIDYELVAICYRLLHREATPFTTDELISLLDSFPFFARLNQSVSQVHVS
jgi:spore coat polysaccharide biosynthesis protein SpsF (cytidylyltransferase family)